MLSRIGWGLSTRLSKAFLILTVPQKCAFSHVVESTNAVHGIFITVNKVKTQSHRALFSEAGRVKVGTETFPKMQFWSIEEFFDNRPAKLPAMAEPESGKALQQGLIYAC